MYIYIIYACNVLTTDACVYNNFFTVTMRIPQPLFALLRFLLIIILGCIIGNHVWGTLRLIVDKDVTIAKTHHITSKGKVEVDQIRRQHKLNEACSGYEV